MKLKKIFAVWVALGALVLVGCKNETDTETVLLNIQGTWISSYGENYKITESAFDNGYYAGDNLVVRYTSETSGYIYFKYTKAAMPDWTYSETAPDVGKWYCVAFKNLKASSISLSGAYKDTASGGKSAVSTLEEAVKEFTVDNGYFSMYSECTRK